jgi:hypothetical protein
VSGETPFREGGKNECITLNMIEIEKVVFITFGITFEKRETRICMKSSCILRSIRITFNKEKPGYLQVFSVTFRMTFEKDKQGYI